jgi:hypothetical protein
VPALKMSVRSPEMAHLENERGRYRTFGCVSSSLIATDLDRLRFEGSSCWSRWRLRTAVAATAADTMAVAANCILVLEVNESILALQIEMLLNGQEE